MLRLSGARILISIFLIIFFLFFWNVFFNSGRSKFKYTCNMTDQYIDDLSDLLERTHQILEKFNLLHFLCYGTLWGQIRAGKLLPWSEKAEFCLLNNEVTAIDEDVFYATFANMQLRLKYVAADGRYIVEFMDRRYPVVEMFLFQLDVEQRMYKRIGWRRRLLPPTCDWTSSLDCFPVNLLELPLPKKTFGQFEYSVPMGGIELQKYHYSHNWWKEIRTKNCNTKTE